MEILGILNMTRDSFSDGGLYVEPERALAHAQQMITDGADIIDLGAQSTRPGADEVPAEEELARLVPVIRSLRAAGVRVSVDTFRPAVMQAVLPLGVEFINDVTALRDPQAVAALRAAGAAPARIVLMHSTSSAARAERLEIPASAMMARIRAFFEQRISELESAGISRDRLIIDPGMGLFLSTDPGASLTVLRNLDRLLELGLPVCISPTRKSFLGHVLAQAGQARPVAERGAGTLACELWAAGQGAQYIRTHDVRALRDAWRVWQAIAAQPTMPTD